MGDPQLDYLSTLGTLWFPTDMHVRILCDVHRVGPREDVSNTVTPYSI